MGERRKGLVHLSRFLGCGKEVFRSHFSWAGKNNIVIYTVFVAVQAVTAQYKMRENRGKNEFFEGGGQENYGK